MQAKDFIELLIAAGLGAVSFWVSQGLLAAVQARRARQLDISKNESVARREQAADWASFAAEMRQALGAERAENASLRAEGDVLRERAEASGVRIQHLMHRLAKETERVRFLEKHITQELGTPPPPRPVEENEEEVHP